MPTPALTATAVGHRFGRTPTWSLRNCTFHLPPARISALIGPNGAGKSTLLTLAAGLLTPAEGELSVLGTTPATARPRIAYVAQDKPLYPQLTVAETLRMGADLNRGRWDQETAESATHTLDATKKIRTLSGGQRTRVALALALGKRPELLLLDEPMADLDPLARHELMGTLMSQAARFGTTIVMSSHVVAELEDSCDHLLLLGDGKVRLSGDIETLLHAHARVTAPAEGTDLTPHTIVESRTTGRQLNALIRPATSATPPATWHPITPTLEDLVLTYLRNPQAAPLDAPLEEAAA